LRSARDAPDPQQASLVLGNVAGTPLHYTRSALLQVGYHMTCAEETAVEPYGDEHFIGGNGSSYPRRCTATSEVGFSRFAMNGRKGSGQLVQAWKIPKIPCRWLALDSSKCDARTPEVVSGSPGSELEGVGVLLSEAGDVDRGGIVGRGAIQRTVGMLAWTFDGWWPAACGKRRHRGHARPRYSTGWR